MKQYIVDAFTDKLFSGNPAAVCVMDKWLPDEMMLSMAKENNLSETAFAVKRSSGEYDLKWFTPAEEIDLCGHATLATAFVILNNYEKDTSKVIFHTLSGILTVDRHDDIYEMDFPAYELSPVEVTDAMEEAIGARPEEAYMGRDLLCVFRDPSVIHDLSPDLEKVKMLDGLLLQVTAEGDADQDHNCISRTFAPKLDVPEDPVCGSGHCHIVPYWAHRLNKNNITAYQASPRGGTLYCRLEQDRVKLAGKAVLYSEAEVYLT